MNKKKVLTGVLVLVLIIGAVGAYKAVDYYRTLKDYREKIATMTINNVDLNKIPDGVYTGSNEPIWVAAEVKVTIKNHRIEKVELVSHKNGKGLPAEVIPQKVVEAQSLEVDIVSGATSSSKVILKAIENALKSGIE